MRTASKVFTIISWIALLLTAFYTVSCGPVSILFFVLWFISIAVGISSFVSDKKVGIGVALILSVNPLSGIFYLCWNGQD